MVSARTGATTRIIGATHALTFAAYTNRSSVLGVPHGGFPYNNPNPNVGASFSWKKVFDMRKPIFSPCAETFSEMSLSLSSQQEILENKKRVLVVNFDNGPGGVGWWLNMLMNNNVSDTKPFGYYGLDASSEVLGSGFSMLSIVFQKVTFGSEDTFSWHVGQEHAGLQKYIMNHDANSARDSYFWDPRKDMGIEVGVVLLKSTITGEFAGAWFHESRRRERKRTADLSRELAQHCALLARTRPQVMYLSRGRPGSGERVRSHSDFAAEATYRCSRFFAVPSQRLPVHADVHSLSDVGRLDIDAAVEDRARYIVLEA